MFVSYTRSVLECYTTILQYDPLVSLSLKDFEIIYIVHVDFTIVKFMDHEFMRVI